MKRNLVFKITLVSMLGGLGALARSAELTIAPDNRCWMDNLTAAKVAERNNSALELKVISRTKAESMTQEGSYALLNVKSTEAKIPAEETEKGKLQFLQACRPSDPVKLEGAIEDGNLPLALELLESTNAGFVMDLKGRSPLMLAARKGMYQALAKILAQNVPITTSESELMRDRDGKTVLHHAVESGNQDVLEAVLEKYHEQFKGNERDKAGYTPLIRLIVSPEIANRVDLAKLVLRYFKRNADGLMASDSKGYTPIQQIVRKDDGAMFEILMQHGADIDKADAIGQTPLMTAVQMKKREWVERLLDAGASVAVFDMEGNSPIHFAAAGDFVEGAKLLIAKGAKVDLKNDSQMTAIDIARKFGSKGFLSLVNKE